MYNLPFQAEKAVIFQADLCKIKKTKDTFSELNTIIS